MLPPLRGQLTTPREGAGQLPAFLLDQGQLPNATKQGEPMNQAILPLAITMMAGPQIMSAIIFVTASKPIKVSASFIAGVAIATTVDVAIALAAVALFGNSVSLGDSSENGSTGHIIQYLLVGALVALAVKNYLGRETAEPPKWLGSLQRADSKKALITGLLVIFLMPSDIIIMLTVAVNLVQSGSGFLDALPFIGATILVAALPILLFLLFHRRAQQFMPKVRDWMNANSWLVNIIVCGVFIALIVL
jgi:Sap, sulfolipid-1-addressing protein